MVGRNGFDPTQWEISDVLVNDDGTHGERGDRIRRGDKRALKKGAQPGNYDDRDDNAGNAEG